MLGMYLKMRKMGAVLGIKVLIKGIGEKGRIAWDATICGRPLQICKSMT